jgi:predicted TIM-barrel fold metal-dependent hydrolase
MSDLPEELRIVPTTTSSLPDLADMVALRGQPYVVMSTDAHAGPSPERDLRPYCPEQYLADFDAYCTEARNAYEQILSAVESGRPGDKPNPTLRELGIEATARCLGCKGHSDPHARLRHLDEEGISADVIFAGGQNFHDLPFMGKGWNAGNPRYTAELRSVAGRMWNRWLADFVSAAPGRLVGVLQTAVWDVESAVREIEWGVERGLRAVNLPAPRSDFLPYTNPIYEPIWQACAANGAVLMTHSAGGEDPLGVNDRRGSFLQMAENQWLGNRGLAQLIFGGVFHRYPTLRFVLAEQRVDFAPDLIRHLDSVYDNGIRGAATGGGLFPASPFIYEGSDVVLDDPKSGDALPMRPSDYWRTNCYLSGSFLAPYEVAQRHSVGLGSLMWGSDYPHTEGTWPYTRVCLRHTFAGVPEDEARLILGETAIGVFGLDRDELQAVAQRIGPTPVEVAAPLTAEELPLGRGGAFREYGSYA